MANIPLEQLGNEIAKILSEYTEDVIEGIDKAGQEVANEAVKELKAKSPKKTGVYAKGWGRKTEKKVGDVSTVIIYNKNKPSLTHLLEHGHAKRGGGRVDGIPHIRPVEEKVIKEFSSKVEIIIEGG